MHALEKQGEFFKRLENSPQDPAIQGSQVPKYLVSGDILAPEDVESRKQTRGTRDHQEVGVSGTHVSVRFCLKYTLIWNQTVKRRKKQSQHI